MSKFGVQPGRRIVRRWMADGGFLYQDLADRIGVTKTHLQTCLAGYVRPADEVRDVLPRLCRVPLGALFTDEALAEPYAANKNPWKEVR